MISAILGMISAILGWLLKGPFGRIMDTVDHKIDNETDRQRIKGDVLAEYLKGQARVMTGPGWWFPLFFVVPLGLYWLCRSRLFDSLVPGVRIPARVVYCSPS